MGLFSGIEKMFGGQTGLGGSGAPDPHLLNTSYSDPLYQKALAGIQNANGQTSALSGGINNAAQSMVGNLANNAAGMKEQLAADSSRNFGADLQNRARAMGGTGNMAQVMMMPGSAYDAQARSEVAGNNQINAMAPQMLGQLTGTENSLFNQNMNQANAEANVLNSQAQTGLGINASNQQAMIGSDAAQQQRQGQGIFGQAMSIFAEGGHVESEVAKQAKARLDARRAGTHAVPGKPTVPGNSEKNDTVPALLSPDEIVIPNSVTHSSNPVKKGAQFIKKTMEHDGGKINAHKRALEGLKQKMAEGGNAEGSAESDIVSAAGLPGEEPTRTYAGGGVIPSSQMGFYGGNGLAAKAISGILSKLQGGGGGHSGENAGQGPTPENLADSSEGIPYASPTFGSDMMAGGGGEAAAALAKGGHPHLRRAALHALKKRRA